MVRKDTHIPSFYLRERTRLEKSLIKQSKEMQTEKIQFLRVNFKQP